MDKINLERLLDILEDYYWSLDNEYRNRGSPSAAKKQMEVSEMQLRIREELLDIAWAEDHAHEVASPAEWDAKKG